MCESFTFVYLDLCVYLLTSFYIFWITAGGAQVLQQTQVGGGVFGATGYCDDK